MSRSSSTLTRLCVGGVAAATLGGVLPVMIAGAAQAKTEAGPISGVTLTPATQTAAATNCVSYTTTVTDQTGQVVSGAAVSLRLVIPNTSTQSVSQCTVASNGTVTAGSALATNNTATTTGSQTTDVASVGTTDTAGRLTFGLAASTAGSFTLQTFFDANGNATLDAGDPQSTVSTETVTVNRFNDSVRAITAVNTATPTVQVSGSTSTYTTTVRDANGVVLNGVTPSFFVSSGPGAQLSTNVTKQGDCTVSNANGQSTCTIPAVPASDANTGRATTSGTQTITFFVDQTQGTTAPDGRLTAGEPTTTAQRTVTGPAVSATTVTVTPTGQTFPGGQTILYSAIARDANGSPVQGVTVAATKTGAGGALDNATQTTDANGRADFRVAAGAFNETGSQSVTVSLSNTTACPGTAAAATSGRAASCTTTATNTISNTPGATPSATATATATPSATSTAGPGTGRLAISVSPSTITPGIQSVVRVTGAVGATVELRAYSRPSTTYRVVRQGVIPASGVIEFRVTPGTNTRLFATVTGAANSDSPSVVINVRTALSLTVVRNGRRNYTFQGRILPRRADQLITLYRVTNSGQEILTAQLKTDATGTYRINRRFTGSGTFGFLARTGQTLTNAAGVSNNGAARQTAIF